MALKKVRKDKDLKYLEKKQSEGRMGAPPLEERDLDPVQRKFALLVGRGIPEEQAQKYCGYTDYQRRTYLKLPKLQQQIEKYRDIFGEEDAERVKQLNDMVEDAAFMELAKRINSGSISENNLLKIVERSLARVSLISTNPAVETTKLIERTKRITSAPKKEIDLFDGSDIEEEEHERSIEERKEN